MPRFASDFYQFAGGMIRWFFQVEGAIYQVNSKQYFSELPDAQHLATLYRYEKRRLYLWIEAREKERQKAWEALPREERHHAIFGGPPPVLPRGPRKKKVKKPMSEPHYFLKKWDEQAMRNWTAAVFPLSDHDYIEAMFWLYSQGRYRLLA